MHKRGLSLVRDFESVKANLEINLCIEPFPAKQWQPEKEEKNPPLLLFRVSSRREKKRIPLWLKDTATTFKRCGGHRV